MSHALIRARLVSFGAVVALLALLLAFGRHVTYEQSITSFFPADDPDVAAYRRASESFGNDNVVFIVYDDPQLLTPAGMDRVAGLAKAVGPPHVGAVIDVQSLDRMPLLWAVDDTLLAIERAPSFLRDRLVRAFESQLKRPGAGDLLPKVGDAIRKGEGKTLKDVKERLLKHPLFRGTVIDDHDLGTTTAVVVRLKGMAEQDPKGTVAELRAAADGFARRHRLARPALVGPPVLLADGFTAIETDGRRLAVVGMALIGLVTLTATRSLWWAIVPILAGWTVWLATETVLATLGLKLSLSGGPLVAQIIVLTMPAASHLAIHFRDDLRREPDRRRAALTTLAAVTAPILWCAATGAIGYGALFTSQVTPIRQFGAILAVCTLLAAVLTFLISPTAMLPPFRLEVPVRFQSISTVGTELQRLTSWVERHPLPIVLGVLAVVAPLAIGIGRIEFESNYINAFKSEARVVRDYRFAEERLGGIGVVSLVVQSGPMLSMHGVEAFRELDRQLLSLRRGDRRQVAHVISPATVLDPDKRLASLPPEKAERALATKLRLIAASPQADLLRSFWNPETGLARVVMRISERQSAPEKEVTFNRARRLVREPGEFGPSSYLTGLSYLLTKTTRGVMKTSWTTFAWAGLGILVMLSLAFGGPRLAALAILPALLAVGLVVGLMGWLGIKLDIATALVASVALGLSVDDTFHCLLQFRRMRAELPFREALLASYAVTGPGVLLSSIAVAIGFAVLRFSQFVPFSNFGTMVGIATAGSSIGNLVLLPACLSLMANRQDAQSAKEFKS